MSSRPELAGSNGRSAIRSGHHAAGLDFPLPDEIAVGGGTALFVAGWCFFPQSPIRDAWLEVDGEQQELLGFRAPRRDVLDQYPDEPYAYRSGFWGIARIAPPAASEQVSIGLGVRLADGSHERLTLGTVRVRRTQWEPLVLPDGVAQGDGPLVAIAMATHEPDRDLFRAQIESIRSQTHERWICVVSDDRSSRAGLQTIHEVIGHDPRFVVTTAPQRLRFYRNFERALSLVPHEVDFVALADQDDRWRPDKLQRLLAAIGDKDLVYSDQRIVDNSGRELAPTYWARRENDHRDVASLLFANCVTGAASLFRRDLLEVALPFPVHQFANFHDHWLALVARLRRGVVYLPEVLGDYVQHESAVLGYSNANRMPTLRERVERLREDPRQRLHRWRLTYFVDCCRLLSLEETLELRLGDRIGKRERRALSRLRRAEKSLVAMAWLLGRACRELQRRRSRTLAAELGLFLAYVWRWLVRLIPAGAERPRRLLRIDAKPPARLIQQPGRREIREPRVSTLAAKVSPIEIAVSEQEEQRVNILIPHVDLKHLFGGYLTKFALARALAEHGYRVRLVAVDPQPPLPADWRQRLARNQNLGDLLDHVEIAFAREQAELRVSPRDAYVATTWWTAHIAHAALREQDRDTFVYLIQEYEPFTFPMGSYAALAAESYNLPHVPLFSTSLLRDFFRDRKAGVFSPGNAWGVPILDFQNPITRTRVPSPAVLLDRRPRRLLFYARPEEHAARNMYELGALALVRASQRGAFANGSWELIGIGTTEHSGVMHLADGVQLKLEPRLDQDSYAKLLEECDVGLALMYTAHPSLVPVEMAATGLAVVTNTYETKTKEALKAISENILATPPTIEGVAEGLCEATNAAERVHERVERARKTRWARDWSEAFPCQLLGALAPYLGGARS